MAIKFQDLTKILRFFPIDVVGIASFFIVVGVSLHIAFWMGYIDTSVFSGHLRKDTPIIVTLGFSLLVIGFLIAIARAISPDKKPFIFEGSSEEIKRGAIAYLQTHRRWYAHWATFYGKLWNVLTCSVIALSALASILSAYGSGVDKIYPTVTAALSALFGTILVQYRVRDMWQLREQGRIDAEKLVANALLIPTSDEDATLRAAVSLRLDAHTLESEQNKRYFGEPSSKQKADEGSNGKPNDNGDDGDRA